MTPILSMFSDAYRRMDHDESRHGGGTPSGEASIAPGPVYTQSKDSDTGCSIEVVEGICFSSGDKSR
jgi:hypothetical protein